MKASDIPSGDAPDWLPDWRDKSAYPKHNSKKRWAWEFLRRNPEYQKDYLHYSSLLDLYPRGGNLEAYPDVVLSENPFVYRCDPPALCGETYHEYIGNCRKRKEEWLIITLETSLMEKWGICHLWNPSEQEAYLGEYGERMYGRPPHFFNFESECEASAYDVPIDEHDRLITLGDRRTTLLSPSDIPDTDVKNHVFVRFDLRYSLKGQWDKVLDLLKDHRDFLIDREMLEVSQPSHPQLTKLPEYLRVYDAVWTKCTQREIAEFLFPKTPCDNPDDKNRKRVKRSLDEARHLILEGYRSLLEWA